MPFAFLRRTTEAEETGSPSSPSPSASLSLGSLTMPGWESLQLRPWQVQDQSFSRERATAKLSGSMKLLPGISHSQRVPQERDEVPTLQNITH